MQTILGAQENVKKALPSRNRLDILVEVA